MSELSDGMRAEIREQLTHYPNSQAVTLPALHMIQDERRYVSNEAIREVAEILKLSPAQVHDTMSFYGFFRTEKDPLGRHRVWICRSISCMLRGAEDLLHEVSKRLGIQPGQTTPDGKVTLEFAECLGACEGAPCILINDECEMNVTADRVQEIVAELK